MIGNKNCDDFIPCMDLSCQKQPLYQVSHTSVQCFKNLRRTWPLLFIFVLFSTQWKIYYKIRPLQQHRWCAWDSNQAPQDCRRRRIHWAKWRKTSQMLIPSPRFFCFCGLMKKAKFLKLKKAKNTFGSKIKKRFDKYPNIVVSLANIFEKSCHLNFGFLNTSTEDLDSLILPHS